MFQVHSCFKLCSRSMCYACKHYIHNILLLLPYPLPVSMYIRQESIQGRYLRVSNGNDCCCGCEMLRNVQHMLPALLLSNTH
uniref:Uncharacterized protein n=1 Tax=Arundo donax TaxID=35708 RepID=A0A0A9HPW3_ARUDO